jgi:menaquinone-specific isochorismate synthase
VSEVVQGPNREAVHLESLPAGDSFAWVTETRSLLGWGKAKRIDPGRGPDRFRRAADALAGHFEVAGEGVAFGSFTFDPLDGNSSLVVPSHFLVRDETRMGAPDPPVEDKIRYAGSSIDEIQWMEAVDSAVKMIATSSLEKVVLARDVFVWTKSPLDKRVLAQRLSNRYPECYTFIHEDLVGATPELLVRRSGDEVSSQVLAGTTARGRDPVEDESLGQELLESAKNAGEHRFAVDSVEDVLGRICSTLTVADTPQLLKLANVQHLATSVMGRLRAPYSALEIAGLLHPTAAVCGTPTETAANVIRDLEGMARGRYAGPVGWVDSSGDGEFGIALRCAEVNGTRARLFAGNGIVAGSLPEEELEETRLKLRAMQSAMEA